MNPCSHFSASGKYTALNCVCESTCQCRSPRGSCEIPHEYSGAAGRSSGCTVCGIGPDAYTHNSGAIREYQDAKRGVSMGLPGNDGRGCLHAGNPGPSLCTCTMDCPCRIPLRSGAQYPACRIPTSVKADAYEEIGARIGRLVTTKQAAYGDSFGKSGAVLAILYPNGISLAQLDDALTITRILDKLFRIATDRDALGETPWQDIVGYGLLSVKRVEDQKKAPPTMKGCGNPRCRSVYADGVCDCPAGNLDACRPLFHKLWGKAKDAPEYSKEEWKNLAALIGA